MATTGLYSPHVNHPEKRIARHILLAVILILFALLTLFPIFYMIMSSFGPAVATAGTSRSIFPRVWTRDSYKAFFAFSKYSVRWIVNSLIVASATVAGNVIFASMAGYAFSKIRFKGRQWLFGLILVAKFFIPIFLEKKISNLLRSRIPMLGNTKRNRNLRWKKKFLESKSAAIR